MRDRLKAEELKKGMYVFSESLRKHYKFLYYWKSKDSLVFESINPMTSKPEKRKSFMSIGEFESSFFHPTTNEKVLSEGKADNQGSGYDINLLLDKMCEYA